ncbi:calmodulin-2/4 [Drosophila eugracilis]|uniref:calmodulin-2/4 n=1 Tax=Drosophila eugracilis TaxID=29029 RepID=UPI0007E6AB56|nr:calmodulin-2/4 [Drosophila eugracilis]
MDPPEYVLAKDDMEEVQRAFNSCDPKKTGRIRSEDLGTVLRALGHNHTESEIYRYVDTLDGEYVGEIAFEGFVEFMTKMYKLLDQDDHLKAAFQCFDQNKNGVVTLPDLRNIFINLGDKITDEEVEIVFRQIDIDGDGNINLTDFIHAYRS